MADQGSRRKRQPEFVSAVFQNGPEEDAGVVPGEVDDGGFPNGQPTAGRLRGGGASTRHFDEVFDVAGNDIIGDDDDSVEYDADSVRNEI